MKKRIITIFLIVFALLIPLFSYFFLDQIYVSRFVSFTNKWIVREMPDLALNSSELERLLKPYEDVVRVADDLAGVGIVEAGLVLKYYGEIGPPLSRMTPVQGDVILERIGFLRYRTTVLAQSSGARMVFFIFEDDMAYANFAILVLAALLAVFVTALARAKMARHREETIRQTTVMAIKTMAHDFRSPFGKLRIFMSQLRAIDPNVFGQLKDMSDSLDSAVEHTDDILKDFLSLEAKSLLSPVACKSLVERLENKYFKSWQAEYPEVELHFICDTDAYVLCNEYKLLRVLFNLLDNALKHAGSRAELRISSSSSQVRFAVINDGFAIPKTEIRNLFKPFYSKRKGGLGLGLFICDSFVREQGGKLKVFSNSSLTEFKFVLPMAKPIEASRTSHKVLNKGQYRIAYIDDEKFYLDALIDTLKNSNVRIDTFVDTSDFLIEFKKNKPAYDLVLVDRFGPNFDAVKDQFDESCRDYGYQGPIVLYSNSVSDEVELKGFTRAIDKMRPLTVDNIIEIIERSI